MSPPIRDGSGNSIGSIRLGDGTEISEVRTGAGDVLFSAIPDSEGLHEWLMDEVSGQTANDRVNNADLSLNFSTWDDTVGVGGSVLDFGTTSDTRQAEAPSADLVDWGDQGSVLIECYPTNSTDTQTIFGHESNPRLYLFLPDLFVGLADTSTDTGHGLTTSDINFDSWQGFGLNWDTGNYDLHIYDFPSETMVSGSGTYSGSVSQSNDFAVGYQSLDDSQHLAGRVDFPKINDFSLTASEFESRFDELVSFY